MVELQSDNCIIDLFFQRNERAIAETEAKYGNYCKKIAMNILNDRLDVEETVSDTYLQTWNSIPPNRPVCFSAYLGKITRNLAINRYRARYAQKRISSEFALSLDELNECVSDSTATDYVSSAALSQCINEFLSKQKKDYRRIFVCRYFYCDSVSEISKRFCMSESKVKSVLFRMRNKLKGYLEDFYEE